MPLDWKNLLILLRPQFVNHEFGITNHARQRQSERDISVRDIISCVITGTILEEQEHGPDPKVLIKGERQNGTPFYIVVALAKEKPVVVTVCNIDENVWEFINGSLRRSE